jgi:DNA-binding GntR family transcriptional regulator
LSFAATAARLVLEPLAVRRAIVYGSPEELDELQLVVDAMAAIGPGTITEQEAAELDIRFHDLIYRAAQHRRLYDCWSNLRPQIHIVLLNRNVAHEDFREYLVKSHQQILDAVRARDESHAVATIEDHLKGSYERVVQSYERRTHRESSGEGNRGGAL